MGDLIKLFIEWARKEKHWPLILLVAILPAFPFLQRLFKLEFPDTFGHWSFLIACGVICAISGVLDWAIIWRRWRRLWLSVPLVIAGVTLVVIGVTRIQSPPPPCRDTLPTDKLVVTIASFTPTAGAAQEAGYITDTLDQTMSNMQDAGAPLSPYRVLDQVPNIGSDTEKKVAAISLGKPPNHCAHAVLWGTVKKDNQGNLDVHARLAIANEWQKRDVIEKTVAEYSLDLTFQQQTSDRAIAGAIADIAALVLGVAYYKVRSWDQAIGIFETVRSYEGRLYKGLCYSQKAQYSSRREEYLETAIETYRTIIDDLSAGGPQSDEGAKEELTAIAHALLADAYLSKGISSSAQAGLTYLENAIHNYDTALMPGIKLHNVWAVENNLGVAQYERAKRSGQNQIGQYLQRAEDAYRSSLRDCVGEEGNGALVHNNLGSALAYWSALAEGEQKNQLLEKASEEMRTAIDFYNGEKPSKQWAMVQTNYANVLFEKGKQAPVSQGDNGYLSRAVEAYKAVLEVYDREKEPQKHATVQHNLGTALFELWKRKELEQDLQDALAAFRIAVDMRGSTGPLQSLANSKRGLAKTLTELGKRAGGARRAAYRTEAIMNFDMALAFYTRAGYPQKHPEILAEKAEAVSL